MGMLRDGSRIALELFAMRETEQFSWALDLASQVVYAYMRHVVVCA
jgi:hypothetical protein